MELIIDVEQRPCLWDITDQEYRNAVKRALMWNEIAQKHGVSVDDCKAK